MLFLIGSFNLSVGASSTRESVSINALAANVESIEGLEKQSDKLDSRAEGIITSLGNYIAFMLSYTGGGIVFQNLKKLSCPVVRVSLPR